MSHKIFGHPDSYRDIPIADENFMGNSIPDQLQERL